MHIDEVADLIVAWHDALNNGDIERLLALSAPDIRVGGPRGEGRGHDVLRAWATGAGIQLVPVAVRQLTRSRYVVEQDAAWPGDAAGDDRGDVTRVASVIDVAAGRIAGVVRYDTLDAARAALGRAVGPRSDVQLGLDPELVRLLREIVAPVVAPLGFEWNASGAGRHREGDRVEDTVLFEADPIVFGDACPHLVEQLEEQHGEPLADIVCLDLWIHRDVDTDWLTADPEVTWELGEWLRSAGHAGLAARMAAPSTLRDGVAALADGLRLLFAQPSR